MEQAAVIILNYNGAHFLEQFLPSVLQHSQGHRIIVADNGSTDHSLDLLRRHYPTVEIMAFPDNYGFALGYDKALQPIDNTYSILLNSDVEVTKGWIEPMIRLMESDPEIAACQPKIKDFYRRDFFEHAGAAGGFIDTLGYPFCRGRILDKVEKDTGQYDDVREIFWATGACFCVRTALYKQMGGFDATLQAHMEEIDLCWRIHKVGYKVYFCPESTIYHVGGGTMPVTNPRKTYLNFRNSTVVLYKNAEASSVFWKVALKIFLDLAAALMFLAKGKYKDSRAVVKAVFEFLLGFSKWQKRRKSAQNRKEELKISTIYPGIMVFDRYFLGKKKFSQYRF
jgi:GT2 family glycosyltransferase